MLNILQLLNRDTDNVTDTEKLLIRSEHREPFDSLIPNLVDYVAPHDLSEGLTLSMQSWLNQKHYPILLESAQAPAELIQQVMELPLYRSDMTEEEIGSALSAGIKAHEAIELYSETVLNNPNSWHLNWSSINYYDAEEALAAARAVVPEIPAASAASLTLSRHYTSEVHRKADPGRLTRYLLGSIGLTRDLLTAHVLLSGECTVDTDSHTASFLDHYRRILGNN
jgi:hypothetical protein